MVTPGRGRRVMYDRRPMPYRRGRNYDRRGRNYYRSRSNDYGGRRDHCRSRCNHYRTGIEQTGDCINDFCSSVPLVVAVFPRKQCSSAEGQCSKGGNDHQFYGIVFHILSFFFQFFRNRFSVLTEYYGNANYFILRNFKKY